MKTYQEIKIKLQKNIRSRIDLSREVSDEEIKEMIQELILEESNITPNYS